MRKNPRRTFELLNLPDDLLIYIASKLDSQTCVRLSTTNKHMNNLLDVDGMRISKHPVYHTTAENPAQQLAFTNLNDLVGHIYDEMVFVEGDMNAQASLSQTIDLVSNNASMVITRHIHQALFIDPIDEENHVQNGLIFITEIEYFVQIITLNNMCYIELSFNKETNKINIKKYEFATDHGKIEYIRIPNLLLYQAVQLMYKFYQTSLNFDQRTRLCEKLCEFDDNCDPDAFLESWISKMILDPNCDGRLFKEVVFQSSSI